MNNFILEKILPLNLHGGFSEFNRESLLAIFNSKKIDTALEIGSWLGLSSSFIAKNVSDKLYCIDPWDLQEEQAQHVSWAEHGPTLYNQFLSNMIHLGLTEKVVPLRGFSDQVLPRLDIKFDLVFIDGSHKYENVKKDILNSSKLLKDGGIICGDDWGLPPSEISIGVIRAVLECASILKKNIKTNNTFWQLE